MRSDVVKFNTKSNPEFFKVLRVRVRQYFKEKGINTYSNANMKIKTVFMLFFYFIPYFLLISGVYTSLWMVMLFWVLMGFGMSGIGLSIMHDANHGAYSKNPRVNEFYGWIVNLLGAYHINWKI